MTGIIEITCVYRVGHYQKLVFRLTLFDRLALDLALVNKKKCYSKKECLLVSHAVGFSSFIIIEIPSINQPIGAKRDIIRQFVNSVISVISVYCLATFKMLVDPYDGNDA